MRLICDTYKCHLIKIIHLNYNFADLVVDAVVNLGRDQDLEGKIERGIPQKEDDQDATNISQSFHTCYNARCAAFNY